MKIRSSIVQKQTQAIVLTQSMQNALKILQCSQLELAHEVEAFLTENMMLEQDVNSEAEMDDAALVQGHLGVKNEQNNLINDSSMHHSVELDQLIPTEMIDEWAEYEDHPLLDHSEHETFDHDAAELSLAEHLWQQLQLLPLSETDRWLGLILIDALDDNGYCTEPLENILAEVNAARPDLDITVAELNVMLHHLQQCDPPGIGAQSLEESLIAQIRHLHPAPTWAEMAIDVLRYHSKWLLQHDLKRIARTYACTEADVITMLEGFKGLNPYPAAAYRTDAIETVLPDIIVTQKHAELDVTLNEEVLPKLRINRQYARLAQQAKIAQRDLLRGQLTEARFFLKSLEDRFDTLLKVAKAIVTAQADFFLQGERAMKALKMQTIAEAVALNESTISRAVAGKYLICSRGTYPLSFFFSNQVTDDEASGVAIRAILQELIDGENKQKPLSDQKLQTLLAARGHEISRRTVAKYRDVLGIKSSTERKQLV
ncbi:RNA polymerase factor sigma-54 [Wohlfahrtiimonas chitiniclastica]|uniref:RNA polymerase factor sigma-54 n=1 Tax=Wohlfahrtiimonas chitiniclastica TaxID=400946 RepID=UPI001BCFBA20|nr:RNA polymerase factor sigma-54 [Wohlfahrtiimonas chitiniclastica]MBS7820452.1 RNA polymerase factor sigma-54 [Wohlfahrtiimonas chitiniclastica]